MPGNKETFSTAMDAADRFRWNSQWTEATQEYQRALAEFPDDAMARGGLGFCYMQTKQWQPALIEYERILDQEPSNVIALSKTAELYVILNRREDAFLAYLHLADLYSQAGQGARAEAAWQKAVQLSPGNPEPHERLAGYYFEKKDIALMIQERLAAARAYLANSNVDAAQKQCEDVLHIDANNIQAQQILTELAMGQVHPSSSLYAGNGQSYTMMDNPTGGSVDGNPLFGSHPTSNPVGEVGSFNNTSGGNTGIMGNMGMGSAGNFGGGNNPGQNPAMANMSGGMGQAPQKQRITASQVTGVLRQAQTFQTQGRFNDAIDLCEQILESGFDRPDARYFLGWLYQEQQRWDEAIQQYQMLLNDPDYALSCYYALGQCYRARGDMRTATVHFDEAVDRVNLDALTLEESDQLVQLCQEAAESHRMLGEQDQALTVYNALLGFLRSRGWNEKVAQVEFMLQQMQNARPGAPAAPPPPSSQPPQIQMSADFSTMNFNSMPNIAPPPAAQPQNPYGMQQPPAPPQQPMAPPQQAGQPMAPPQQPMAPPQQAGQNPAIQNSTAGDLPDWLTGILNDAEKSQVNKQATPRPPQQPPTPPQQPPVQQNQASFLMDQPPAAPERPIATPPTASTPPVSPGANSWLTDAPQQPAPPPAQQQGALDPFAPPAPQNQPLAQGQLDPFAPPAPQNQPANPFAQPQKDLPDPFAPPQQQQGTGPQRQAQAQQPGSAADFFLQQPGTGPQAPVSPQTDPFAPPTTPPVSAAQIAAQQGPGDSAINASLMDLLSATKPVQPQQPQPQARSPHSAEDLLSQMAGSTGKDQSLRNMADAVLTSTASLPEQVRTQVMQSMRDIQQYIHHGLLIQATDECLKVIEIAPQYLDVHQILSEIYVRQGKIEQAVTKYAILVDTYVANGRIDDAISTYRRILQLEPNNLTYRVRLINLLQQQGNKEELLRERTAAAEGYLRLGYMERALTELEQALQESPTSVSTRLNYALALQKLGRTNQAVAEYQRVLQVDPRNLVALVRWHIAMITGTSPSSRSTSLDVLTRVRWQLRGEGQRNYDMIVREYSQSIEVYPNNADLHFALGQVHQQAGAYDKALDEYNLAMRDSSYEVMARVSSARCLMKQGKPEAAINQLEQALQTVRKNSALIDPSVWAARPREEGEEHQAPEVEISRHLADAYGRTGRKDQQDAILRQVKQATTFRDEVSSAVAEISARQGDSDLALQEYLDLAHHYRNKRQTDSAIKVLNEMVRLAPQDPRPHAELGDIYVNRGLLDEGIAELRMLADIYLRQNKKEEAGDELRRVGNIYAEMDNTEDAMRSLRRAAELRPSDMDLLREVVSYFWQWGFMQDAVTYQVSIARYYFETHQVKESVAALQQLIALDRNNYEAYDMLGQTYQSVGEYDQASRVYRNLAKVNPDSDIARERLASLQELRTKSL